MLPGRTQAVAAMNRKVVIADSNFRSDDPERETLRETGARIERHQCRTEEEVLAAAADADALLVQFAPITRKVIEGLQRCRIIVRYGIGTDNVDVAAASAAGIPVCNVPDYCLDEVADHTAAFVLALSRKLLPLHRSVENGLWQAEMHARPLPKPEQSIVGLVGMGRIGERVVRRLLPFGFRIRVYDPYLPASHPLLSQANVMRFDGLEALWEQADIVSLHVPLTPQTRHIVDERSLGRMKPTAFLVNCSRGQLVDNEALARALSGNVIAGAALDVFEEEPLPSGHPLRRCQNLLMTPHAAYYSDEAFLALQRQAAEEVARGLRGEPLRSRVDR